MASARELLASVLREEVTAVQTMHDLRAQFVRDRLDGQLRLDAAMHRALVLQQEQKLSEERITGEETEGKTFPPRYSGRPAAGFTSAALQIAAEHHRGFAPPHGSSYRGGYRDVIHEGATLSSAYLSPVLERSGALTEDKLSQIVTISGGLGALNPGMIREANEAIKQPQYNDRGFGLPLSARGDSLPRRIAIASDLDATARDEDGFFAERERALLAVANLATSPRPGVVLQPPPSEPAAQPITIKKEEDTSEGSGGISSEAALLVVATATVPEVVMAEAAATEQQLEQQQQEALAEL